MIEVLRRYLLYFPADEVNEYSITLFRPSASRWRMTKGDIELRSTENRFTSKPMDFLPHFGKNYAGPRSILKDTYKKRLPANRRLLACDVV
jgi:hypothetical protein